MPSLDIIRLHDIGMRTESDPDILEHAAQEGLIVLTHDASTMSKFAADRQRSGQPLPGLVVIPQSLGIGPTIADLLILFEAGKKEDFQDQVLWLPL